MLKKVEGCLSRDMDDIRIQTNFHLIRDKKINVGDEKYN